MSRRLSVTLFHDLLSPICALAGERLATLARELSGNVSLTYRACPLWMLNDTEALSPAAARREARRSERVLRAMAREPEGLFSSSEFPWPTRSSLPPLLAAEAALLEGTGAQERFLKGLRQAAFLGGLDVTRKDVLLEVADRARIDLAGFSQALESETLRARLEQGFREAMSRGVWAVPAVAIDERWLLTGLRPLDEYRATICLCLGKRAGGPSAPSVH